MIWAGLGGLLVAAVCAWLARAAHGRARTMEATETLPARDLRALREAAAGAAGTGHFRHRCEVTGQARAHKNGALRSELEGQECVWHRHRITRKYEEIYRDGKGNRRRRTRTEEMSRFSSATAFFVEDETGRTVIRPGDHEVVGAEKILDRFDTNASGGGAGRRLLAGIARSSSGGTLGYRREEWIVRAGTRLFVHGEATDASGRLALGAPAEGGLFVMSAKSERELLGAENRKVMAFGLTTAAATLAGCAFLVAAAL